MTVLSVVAQGPNLASGVETPNRTQSVDWKKAAIITAIALVAIVSVGLIAASIVASSGGSLAAFGIAAAFLGSNAGLGTGVAGAIVAALAGIQLGCHLRDKSTSAAFEAASEAARASHDRAQAEAGQLFQAVRGGNIDSVRTLITNRTISTLNLGQALQIAASRGNQAIVQLLLSGNRILSYDLNQSFFNAAQSGHEDVIRALLDTRRIPEIEIQREIHFAVDDGHEAIVRILLPSVTELSLHLRNTLILTASSLGWNDILENLLQRGPIGTSLRDSALTQARNDSIRHMLGMASLAPDPLDIWDIPSDIAEDAHLPTSDLRLSLVDLKENPLRWLSHVTERGLPAHVSFSEYPSAVDVGGITKQFITTLVEALISKEGFKRTEDGLPLIVTQQDRDCLRQLGHLYSMLHERNGSRSDKILTGTLFHPRFLELVKNAGSSESEAIKLSDAASTLQGINASYRCLTAVILEPNAANKAAYREAYGCEEGEEEQGAKEQLQEYLDSARAFYDGCTERFKEYMAGSEASTALASIQGEDVTADKLITALRLEGSGADLRQKFEWIQEKIRGADKPFLIKFLKAITGKTTLTPGTEIKIKESWREGQVFEIHTCFNSIDVPKGTMEKEAFLAALEGSVSGEGYNIA